ncbi:MAG TPA: hypothetical protein VFT34_14645 [Verrucomicrobiae bacterium]|nr:hypothetical protein [Verrucomicrobiae bacterium]
MSIAMPNSEAAIWSRALHPDQGDLSPEAARSILRIHLSATDHSRLNELAAKAAEGTLTEAEERELDSYRNVGRLLELMKSKARRSLPRDGTVS